MQISSEVLWSVSAQVGRSGWEGWPFGGDMSGGWLAMAARLLFVFGVFALLALLLRKLFGPGGVMRPEEFGTEHIEERQRKKAKAAELRAQWKAGTLSDDDYVAEQKRLWEDETPTDQN